MKKYFRVWLHVTLPCIPSCHTLVCKGCQHSSKCLWRKTTMDSWHSLHFLAEDRIQFHHSLPPVPQSGIPWKCNHMFPKAGSWCRHSGKRPLSIFQAWGTPWDIFQHIGSWTGLVAVSFLWLSIQSSIGNQSSTENGQVRSLLIFYSICFMQTILNLPTEQIHHPSLGVIFFRPTPISMF